MSNHGSLIQRRWSTLAVTLLVLSAFALVGAPVAASPQFGEWSDAQNLGSPVNSSLSEFGPAITPDGLSLYFSVTSTTGNEDIWVSHRDKKDDAWGTPVNLTVINTSFGERVPSFSRNGRVMFFGSDRPTGFGDMDIWVSTRTNQHDDFGWQAPVNLGSGVNSAGFEAGSTLFEPGDDEGTGGAVLIFNSDKAGSSDLYVSTRGLDGSFGPATPVSELNTAVNEARPTIRGDGLEIFFHSTRPGGPSGFNLWTATRATTSDTWSPPVMLRLGVNSAFAELTPYLSKDGRTLFFQAGGGRGGSGLGDIWMTTREKGGPDE